MFREKARAIWEGGGGDPTGTIDPSSHENKYSPI